MLGRMGAQWMASHNETKATIMRYGRQVELAKRRLAGEHPASLMVAELAARHSQRPHWRDLQVGPAASGCYRYCQSCRMLPFQRRCRGSCLVFKAQSSASQPSAHWHRLWCGGARVRTHAPPTTRMQSWTQKRRWAAIPVKLWHTCMQSWGQCIPAHLPCDSCACSKPCQGTAAANHVGAVHLSQLHLTWHVQHAFFRLERHGCI